MPRIRTIKPEFWDSPSTAKASAVARLAFIGMWNWADDAGRGTANLKELEGFIFPNDDVRELSGGASENFRHVVAEVSDCFGVVFYEVHGRPYYAIPTWSDHQRNERVAKSKYPGPDEADSLINTGDSGASENFRHVVAELPRTSDPGTGEQGNRGTVLNTSPSVSESDFNNAYSHWPKKVQRKKSLEQFKKKAKDRGVDVLVADIVKFGDAYAATTETKFVPALDVWLRNERWTDDLPGVARVVDDWEKKYRRIS